MAIDYNKLINWKFEDVVHSYSERDVILYALGLGLGRDPLNRSELKYVYERGLVPIPTMAVTLSTLGMWVKNPDTGITWSKVVHSAQESIFFNPLPTSGTVIGKARISEIHDRGPEKGAKIMVERSIYDSHNNECYCTLRQTLILKADGGFGGPAPKPDNTLEIPDRAADITYSWKTFPGQAIIYRLSGDWNPLHIDPEVASGAGFSRPILHGYCSYGIAACAASIATGKPINSLGKLQCRFTSPVMPGDEIKFQFWVQDDDTLLFRALVSDRVVMDSGLASLAG